MSYDWTKEELLQELNERKAEGESEETTFNFIWAVVERTYQERDHYKGEAKTDYRDPPEITAAWREIAEQAGLDEKMKYDETR